MPAPKGNKFALGLTTSGCPPIYNDTEVLLNKINEYFESLLNEDQTEYLTRPTITGLSLYLGFDSRSSFYNYSKKEEFLHIIKRAQLVVEMSYEEMLHTKASTGAIFALKNMSWVDKQEIESTNRNIPSIPIVLSDGRTYDDLKGELQPE